MTAMSDTHDTSLRVEEQLDCGCGEHCSCDPPRALLRNTYFPRKLMEVRHWRAEQTYHRRSRELVTRLGFGSGVLCGLEVTEVPGGTLLVSHGVGIDGHGRLVVVPHDVEVDPARLTDPCGRPEDGPSETGTVTVSVCYHECGTDPVRMPPEGCDGEVRCVPAMVREAYAVTVTEGPSSRTGLPDGLCDALFHDDPEGSGEADRRTLLDRLGPRSCDCTEHCVPLATVTLDGDQGSRVDTTVRTVIRSNRELLDLILCLADRVDECCPPAPAALAPRITSLSPWPDNEGNTWTDFAEDLRLEIAFDRDMAEPALDDPQSWLGVWLIEPDGARRVAVVRAAGVLGQVVVPPGGDGAAYTVEIERQDIRPETCVVVMVRSEASGPIHTADPDQLALDADLFGTGLGQEQRDKLWAMAPASAEPSYGSFLPDALTGLPVFPPSGNGAAGGELHVSLRPPVETEPPPRLLRVWPAGGTDYNEDESWKSFIERPRLEITVSRTLADAAVAAPREWLRLWQASTDGDYLYAIEELGLESGEIHELEDDTVRVVFPLRPPDDWQQTFVAQLRSTPPLVPESPLGKDDPTVLLDADFAGTALDSQLLFRLWSGETDFGGLLASPFSSTDGSQLWDGSEGGVMHWGFKVRRP
ncbi:hypothetical protein ACWF0M_01315 [Kribbella sp. NPDC055110]